MRMKRRTRSSSKSFEDCLGDEEEDSSEQEEAIELLTLPEYFCRCWEGFEDFDSSNPTIDAYANLGIDLPRTSTEIFQAISGIYRPMLHYDHDEFTAIGHLKSFGEIIQTPSLQLTLECHNESSRFRKVSQRSTFRFVAEGRMHEAKRCHKLRIAFLDLPSVGGRAELSIIFTESTRGLEEQLKRLLSSALLLDCFCTDDPTSSCKASLWRQLKANSNFE